MPTLLHAWRKSPASLATDFSDGAKVSDHLSSRSVTFLRRCHKTKNPNSKAIFGLLCSRQKTHLAENPNSKTSLKKTLIPFHGVLRRFPLQRSPARLRGLRAPRSSGAFFISRSRPSGRSSFARRVAVPADFCTSPAHHATTCTPHTTPHAPSRRALRFSLLSLPPYRQPRAPLFLLGFVCPCASPSLLLCLLPPLPPHASMPHGQGPHCTR